MSKDWYIDDRDIAFGDKGKPITIGGHLGPETRFFHYGRNGNLFLHDSVNPLIPSWVCQQTNPDECAVSPYVALRSTHGRQEHTTWY